jgi:hypothetical protein
MHMLIGIVDQEMFCKICVISVDEQTKGICHYFKSDFLVRHVLSKSAGHT